MKRLREYIGEMQRDKVLLFSKAKDSTRQVQQQRKVIKSLADEVDSLKKQITRLEASSELRLQESDKLAESPSSGFLITEAEVRVRPTQNKKFETFLETLLAKDSSNREKGREIVEYVQNLETGYTRQLRHVKDKCRLEITRARSKTNLQATSVDKRNELERVFADAVKTIKAQIDLRKNAMSLKEKSASE